MPWRHQHGCALSSWCIVTLVNAKRVSVAPDSFKETLHSVDVARAICSVLNQARIECDSMPMSDGGEGFADVVATAIRDDSRREAQVSVHTATVTGPTGSNVLARYYLAKEIGQPVMAVMDCASASGLALAGGAESNDPVAATSQGTGELIADAINSGAQVVLIGLGGSATTDGGRPAIEAAEHLCQPDTAKIVACYDVKSRFTEAARVFAPQKGATPEQVDILYHRLEDLAIYYKDRYGVDVTHLVGGGAAGGLGGGLTLLGADLVPGFDIVAKYVHLEDKLKVADLVITGEGKLDATSFKGKVVGSIIQMAHDIGVPVAVIAGSVEAELMGAGHVRIVSLVDQFGRNASFTDTISCIEKAVNLICD